MREHSSIFSKLIMLKHNLSPQKMKKSRLNLAMFQRVTAKAI
jgi:hypothetical protein